ncbi:MAG: carboxymuconolactone decarboxylase family protein [Blastomonas sp.]
MSRIAIPAREAAPSASQPLLDAVEKSLGSVPNLFRLISHSPVALDAYLGQNGKLARALDVKTRERIALAVAQVNGCDYCLSAHSYLGQNLARLDAEEIARNRQGLSGDPKASAAVAFAAKVANERGRVDDADLARVRQAGFSEGQIVEIVALVAENVFTNFLNNVAQTEIDFPVVTASDFAAAA